MPEGLSGRPSEFGVTAAVAALESSKVQADQAAGQMAAAATALGEAAQAAEASKQA